MLSLAFCGRHTSLTAALRLHGTQVVVAFVHDLIAAFGVLGIRIVRLLVVSRDALHNLAV